MSFAKKIISVPLQILVAVWTFLQVSSYNIGLLFVIFKLIDLVQWPWIWVLSPFWIPIVFGLTVLLLMLVFFLICILGAILLD